MKASTGHYLGCLSVTTAARSLWSKHKNINTHYTSGIHSLLPLHQGRQVRGKSFVVGETPLLWGKFLCFGEIPCLGLVRGNSCLGEIPLCFGENAFLLGKFLSLEEIPLLWGNVLFRLFQGNSFVWGKCLCLGDFRCWRYSCVGDIPLLGEFLCFGEILVCEVCISLKRGNVSNT